MEQWQIVTPHSCVLGEGPVWDSSERRILWVDIEQGQIHQFFLKTKEHLIFEAGEKVCAIALCAKGGLIAVLQTGFAGVNLDNGTIEKLTDPESHLSGNRFNDAKCDPAGRFWAGTMSLDGISYSGSLYCLESDQQVSVKIRGIGCANGLCWDERRDIFYFIDTLAACLYSFDYDRTHGNITNQRVIAAFPKTAGFADGMTIDADGNLWIAVWDGWQIQKREAVTGKLLERIMLPVSRPTSCTFGGNDLRDLFITSASAGLTEAQRQMQPHAGKLLVIKNAGKGLASYRYQPALDATG